MNANKRLLVNDPAYSQNILSDVLSEMQSMKLQIQGQAVKIQSQDLTIQTLEAKLSNVNTNNCSCPTTSSGVLGKVQTLENNQVSMLNNIQKLVNTTSPSRGNFYIKIKS